MDISLTQVESACWKYINRHASTYDLNSDVVREHVHSIALEVYVSCYLDKDFTYYPSLVTTYCNKFCGYRFKNGVRELLSNGKPSYRHYFTLPTLKLQIPSLHELATNSSVEYSDDIDTPIPPSFESLISSYITTDEDLACIRRLLLNKSYPKLHALYGRHLSDQDFDRCITYLQQYISSITLN